MRNMISDRKHNHFQLPTSSSENFLVSDKSCWSDPIWHFEAVTAGSSDAKLIWGMLLHNGELLTDSGYDGLLQQARRLFWSIIKANQRGRHPKVTSYEGHFTTLRYLLTWMVKHGKGSFSEIHVPDSWSYLGDVAEELARRGTLSQGRLAAYADCLCRAHEQSTLFRDFPENVMRSRPFGGMSAIEAASVYAPKGQVGFIEPVPDQIYVDCMATALEWVDVRAEDILNLQDIYLEERSFLSRSKALRSHSYGWHLNGALSKYRFDQGGVLHEPWRPALPKNKAISTTRMLVQDLRDAGVILLQGMLGLRISEVCGIQAGEMKSEDQWPTCITVSPSISGLNQLFHLHGRVYKQQDEYAEDTWLAGSRPIGSSYIPPAVRAVTMLWRLYQPWRELSMRKELIVTIRSSRGFAWQAKHIGRPMSESLGQSQREWAEEHIQYPAEYENWHLSTHQWRKSFAMYMVRSDSRMLPAVRDHFKHMSIAMTEQGYLGRDPEMLGLLEDEATYAAARFLFEAVNGRPAAGRMMETIQENRESILDLIDDYEGSEESKISSLAEILKDDDVRLWASPWGNCLFRNELARCHYRAKGHFDLNARRPDYGQRTPGVCCDCANLLIFNDNAAFWEARLNAGLQTLKKNREVGEHAAARVAEDRVHTSAKILRRLGVNVILPSAVNYEAGDDPC